MEIMEIASSIALDIVLFMIATMIVATAGRFLVICLLCELKIDTSIPKWMILAIGLSEFYSFVSPYFRIGNVDNGVLRLLGIKKWEWAKYKRINREGMREIIYIMKKEE